MPTIDEVSDKFTSCPLHNVKEFALVTTGVGFTSTFINCELPEHPFALGVTVYVTV